MILLIIYLIALGYLPMLTIDDISKGIRAEYIEVLVTVKPSKVIEVV